MKNKKFIIISSLAIVFLWSCQQEEGTVYTSLGDITKEVSFASAKFKQELVEEDGLEVKVKLQRAQALGELNVPITFKSSSALFTMTDTIIHFADGDTEAYGVITHSGANSLGVGTTYTITVSIDDKINLVSVGGIKTQTLTFSRRLTWTDMGKGKWTDGIVPAIFTAPVLTYDVLVQKSEESDGVFRLVNLYGFEVNPATEAGDVLINPCYVVINAENPDKVIFIQSSGGLGVDYGYGEVFLGQAKGGIKEDKTITFPAQALLIGMKNYNDGKLSFYAKECKLVLP